MQQLKHESNVFSAIWARGQNHFVTCIGIAVIVVLCLSACGSQADTNQTTTAQASWAQYYTSFKDLKQHADFAVSGNITQISNAIQPCDTSPVYSNVTLAINKVMWNAHAHKTVPQTILFHENGGICNGKTYVVSEDPLYQSGQQVILFFTEYSPGKYRVTGGPTGRFIVDNQHVKPIVSDGVQLPPNTTVDTFTQSMNTTS